MNDKQVIEKTASLLFWGLAVWRDRGNYPYITLTIIDTEGGIAPQLLVQMVVNITVRDFTFVLITISPYNN